MKSITPNADSPQSTATLTIDQALQQAVTHHQAGRFTEAEELYRSILRVEPKHPDANHNLGLMAMQLNKAETGLPYLQAAWEADPSTGQYWLTLTECLLEMGQSEGALLLVEDAIRRGLDSPQAQQLLMRAKGGRNSEMCPAVAVEVAEPSDAGYQQAESLFDSAAAPQNSKKPIKAKPTKSNKSAPKFSIHRGKALSPQEINTLGALFNEGRYAEVVTLAQKITVRFPMHWVGWKALGTVFNQMGRNTDALAPMQKAAALLPGDAETHSNLGNALHGLDRLDEAEASYRRALQIKPDYAEAYYNLGVNLQGMGRMDEAEASYRRALEIKPDYAEAYNNLGNTLKDMGRLDEAESSYRRALQIKPDYAEAHYNLGNTLQDLSRLGEAEASYRRALQIKPDYAEAHNNLGNTFRDMSRLGEAETSYRRALQFKPDYAEAHNNLGSILDVLRRLAEAEASCRRALEVRPGYADAHQNLATVLAHLSDFEQVITESDTAMRLKPDDPVFWEQRLYTFSYHPDLSAEQIYAEFVRWGDRFPDPVTDFSAHDRTPGRRLRIGYVSPDFRRHTSRFFFWPLFANHDPAAVELYAYSNVKVEDKFTGEFKGLFDHWRNIRGVADEEAARIIREDGIDILVDCCNHMQDDRLGVFALKPAPVQATWLGAAWTTGLKTVDYALIDPYMAPEGTLTREAIVRLPQCFVAYRPPEESAEIAPPPCLENGYVTFGYSGRTERLNHRTFRVWGEILRRIPDARLILDFAPFADPPTQAHYREFMAKHGMDPGRVIMRKSANIFAGLNDIDILLDCFPHSGGTMLFDALWMGVPILTLASRPPVGRIGTSLMTNLGLPEWVAESEEEYIGKACAFTQTPGALAELRAGMRERMRNSPIMDGAGFARGVEVAYRGMFEKWAQGLQGDPMDVLARHMKGDAQAAEPSDTGRRVESLSDSEVLPQNSKHPHKTKSGKQNKFAAKFAIHQTKSPSHQEIEALMALFNERRYAEAATLAQKITERFPMDGWGWKALGTAFKQMGRNADALMPMRKAAEWEPGDAETHSNLGVILQDMGLMGEAEASYRRALQVKPDYADAQNNLGVTLNDLGRLAEAEASYRCALQVKPDYADAHNNLGVTLKNLSRLDEAEASYRRALQIKPDYADAHNNLGVTLNDLGRLAEAEASYRRALQVKPDYADAYNNLGVTLNDMCRLDEAEASYRQALEIKPGYEDAFSNLLFVLNYHPDKSAVEIFESYREYDARFGLPHRSEWRPYENSLETQRRLKVGYVSPDFKRHSVRHFLEPLLAHHDQNTVEVYAYAELSKEDEVTARYKGYVEHWVPTAGMSDAALVERIRADSIDILVDLAGHSARNRLGVFARKPTPVSLSYLGYGYSTGLTAIDYVLTDKTSAPVGSEGLFSENPWRLTTPGYIYRPAEGMGELGPLPAMGAGHVTFGILSRGIRINHRVIRVCSEILKRVEGARLVIDSKDFREAYMQDVLAEKFAAHGIGRNRLQIGFHSPPWEVMRGLDIGLDCFPHNSGTTLFENLYMGIPYITLAGRPSVGRIGSSVLEGVGHPEWIAETEDEYVERAVALAGDLPKLSALRAGLRQEMQAGPLMDEPAFARKVEDAYRAMFVQWVGSDGRGDVCQGVKASTSTGALTVDQAFQQAVTHHQAGQFAEAEELYRSVLQVEPRHPDANHNLGLMAMQLNKAETGLPYLQAALEANPSIGQYWLTLTECLLEMGQSKGALLLVEDAIRRGLDSPQAQQLLMRAKGGRNSEMQPVGAIEGAGTSDAGCQQAEPLSDSTVVEQSSKKASKQDKSHTKFAKRHLNPSHQEIDTLMTLFNEGRYAEVATLTQAMVVNFPLDGFCWKALGTALNQMGRHADALSPMQKAAVLLPDDAEAHNNLGNTLKRLGRLTEAEASYRCALQIKPGYAEAHYNLGSALQDMGRMDEAEASYRRALQIKPDYVEAYYNLGITLQNMGRLNEAEASYRRTLQIKPDYTDASNNLGVVLVSLDRLDEAEASYRHTLEIKPDCAEAHNNLGNLFRKMDRLSEAEVSYRHALEINLEYADAYNNMGSIYCDLRRLAEAEVNCRRALEIKPDYADAHQNLSFLLAYLSDFDQVVTESDAAMRLKPDDPVFWEQRLYAFSYHPDLTAEQIYGEFVRWGDRFPDPVTDFGAHDRTPGRRLKIGYVSPDFRNHTSRFYFWPLFANHDPAAVELYAYSNVKVEDDVTQEFKGLFDHWRNIRGIADDEAARMIREDRIDILVDGCSHMQDDRLGVFTLKPAPIQATWLGAAWTTGLKMVDYALIDPYMAPEGTLTRETIVRLPHSFVAYRPPEGTVEIAQPPCLENDYVTFGYSGRTERLNHRTFRVWGKILRRIPDARLILDFAPFADPPTQAHYRAFMAKHGMDPGRVIMRKSANIFEGLNDIDILLDCFPHSGGTMLFDALWMGVPVLTLASRPPVGRIGTSLMINLGLSEWVAESEEEYIAKACAFAQAPQVLAELRAGMRERMRNSPLMDGPGFARGVEAAYRGMFGRWCEKDR